MPFDRQGEHGAKASARASEGDTYWREAYESRTYGSGRSYEELLTAYSYGWESRTRFMGRTWEEMERDLEREWATGGGLSWEEVRVAVRDAWSRAEALAPTGKGYEGSATGDDAYWRENYSSRPYSDRRSYTDYQPAYRYGWEAEGSAVGGGMGGAGGGPTGSPPPSEPQPETLTSADPPATYALLSCPEVVLAEKEFEIRVGISSQPMSENDEPLEVPTSPEYRLVVHVVTDGFRLREGESERNELAVTREKPYPILVLHLTPMPQDTPVLPRLIRAKYSINGQAVGFAARSVAVVENPAFIDWVIQEERPQPGTISIPTTETAPDLTISILKGDLAGDLLWTLESPHEAFLPHRRFTSNLGNEPERFARLLVDKMNVREGTNGVYGFLLGHGLEISKKVPVSVWEVLRKVATKHSGQPLTVLILSDEPYVPWELAVMPVPLLDESAPPFLATQVNVGRWVMPSGEKPKLPPPAQLNVKTMAVVSGVYDDPDFQPLTQAVQETADLENLYGAVKVNADFDQVSKCLQGEPEVELLHFAVHGVYDPKGIQNGLVLVDKRTLDPFDIKGVNLTRAPFVFLNACQVGSGDKVLGDYAGLAEAFLFAGASGVIAPLWSVKDDLAKQIALDFYLQVAAGRQPAAVLRSERARFHRESTTATYLAYQFFGHPLLKLVGLRSRG